MFDKKTDTWRKAKKHFNAKKKLKPSSTIFRKASTKQNRNFTNSKSFSHLSIVTKQRCAALKIVDRKSRQSNRSSSYTFISITVFGLLEISVNSIHEATVAIKINSIMIWFSSNWCSMCSCQINYNLFWIDSSRFNMLRSDFNSLT